MKSLRKQLINWLFEKSMVLYCRFKKKQPWGLTSADMLNMPPNTFGHRLGQFLSSNGFEPIPKVERHDAYHVLCGYSTAVEDEIALQYVCFGNGKRTPYLFGVLLLGTFILPDYLPYYLKSYRFGKQAATFHPYDFKKILRLDFNEFRSAIFTDRLLTEMYDYRKTHQLTQYPTLL
ncbi:hypothetical protein POV27_10320 [Aureisphaera galaxeae]|uniref:hypothetical protein n=1 Tax=Aureisphaera galaxeae TaxID=1538023 RepID=UPI00234FC84B|nr:hypothetical protein [Aureisphaera galaxeae]MDC8004446.1 hypothetical protein [Aureisphaera galaxeae]